MAARAFDPFRLDVQVFASDNGELSGRWPLQDMTRLADSMHSDSPATGASQVGWSARGELRAARGGPAQVWLHLRAEARLQLECQRCLQAVESELSIHRWFLFVPGEDAAAQMDSESEDDVLALTRALDLRDLVEDELLLALPLVPRHDVCPTALSLLNDAPQASAGPVHPFAVLATLKRGGSLN
ncbi:MAG: hypothetical protein AD742_15000 [Methylibium sp. NZG]|nr:MAG: hypothetical protein AD742_15000 [Methylibium sp. NZG]